MSTQLLIANWESISLYWFIVWTLTATAVWAGAAGWAAFLRRNSAHARHRVWMLSMFAVLIAPLVAPLLPLPRWWSWSHEEEADRIAIVAPPSRVTDKEVMVDSKQSAAAAPNSNRPSTTHDRSIAAPAPVARLAPGTDVAASRPELNESAPRLLAWRSILIATWLGGAALSLLMFAIGLWRIRLLRRRAVPLLDGVETTMCRELRQRLGIRRNVKLLVTPRANVPFLAGIFDSAIVLPSGFGRWAPQRLRVVLTHELIHLQRNDVLWEIVAQLAMIPAWFHPLGWFATKRLRVERELACDDAVLIAGERPADYAEQLVEVAAELRSRTWRPAPVVAIAGASPIERRVRSILDPRVWRAPLDRWRAIALSTFMALLVIVVAALSPTSGQEKLENSVPAGSARTAQPVDGGSPDALSPEIAAADQRITDELDKSTTLKRDNVLLEDALLVLSRRHGIPIRLETWSFNLAGVVLLPNVIGTDQSATLRSVLRSLIESASGDATIKTAIRAKDGVLSVGAANVDEGLPGRGDEMILIRGTVHAVDGKPAAGCEIIVHRGTQTIVLCANDQGAFTLPMRASQPYQSAILMRSASGRQQAIYRFEDVVSPSKGVEPLNVTLQNTRTIIVAVTDGEGKSVARARAAITGTQGAFDRISFDGLTDAAGEFTARVPENLQIGYIYAFKAGAGLDYHSYVKPPRSTDLQVIAPQQPVGRAQLVLAAPRSVTIKYVDDDGRPIAGLMVNPWYFHKPSETDDLNIGGVPWFYGNTNATGEVTFDWIPKWNDNPIVFSPYSKQFSNGERLVFDPKQVQQQPRVVTLRRRVELSGRVRDDAGKPAADASVVVSGKGYSLNAFRDGVTTDHEGRYRFDVPPHQLYMLAAYSKDGLQASAIRDGIPVYPGKSINNIELTLRPATRAFGRLTLGAERKPIEKYNVIVYAYGRDLNNMTEVSFPHDPNNHWWIQPLIVRSVLTDADGRYEFHLGPGKYDVRGTRQNAASKFEITDQKELEFNFHSERPDRGTLRGIVVTGAQAKPVPSAKISGVTQGGFGGVIDATADSEGMFEVQRDSHPAVLYAYTNDRSLGGIVEIGADDKSVTIPIAATASYTAKIVDKDKKPLSADRQVEFGIVVHVDRKDRGSPFSYSFGGVIQPDQEGRVRFNGLVVGATYDAHLHNLDGSGYSRITAILPKEAGDHDLGELTASPREAYHPPTFEEQIAQAFERPISAVERNRDAKNFARLADAHVLVTFANPQAPLTKKLYKLYFDGDLSSAVNDDFRTVAIPTAALKRDQAAALAKELGVELPNDDVPLIVAESVDGKVLGVLSGSTLVTKENEIAEAALLTFVKQHAPPRLDGRKLFDDALAQAKRENKRLLVDETAVWCGPCHMLAAFLDKNRADWDKDYLWIKMDPRWPHATEIMKSLRGEASGGYPWFAILDADGKVLATSNKPDGDNIGFPSEPDSVEHFLHMLKTTAQRMTNEDFARLKTALEAASKGH
jgi:beta-lactamase regulating signal transducer with metallopeptidase domain